MWLRNELVGTIKQHGPAMTPGGLQILYEDNHLLAVNKPPGLPTMGVAAGEMSLVVRAKQYIKHRYHKPGAVFLGVVSRLDTATSGVVILARTSKAAARLTEQFKSRSVQKTYWAIVSGKLDPPAGELVDWVVKDESQERMIIVGPHTAEAKEAKLRYNQLRELTGGSSLLEIQLLTGRKHQIRLQLGERGHPVWGEWKYGRGRPFPAGLALHSRRLVFEHPVKKSPVELVADLPPAWRSLGLK
jgi:23S rRNA pseudouridine1911/1915/1917 synthase